MSNLDDLPPRQSQIIHQRFYEGKTLSSIAQEQQITPEMVRQKEVSAAQRKATDKYLEKFDEMRVRAPKGQKEAVKAHAEAQGESVNAFINRAINEKPWSAITPPQKPRAENNTRHRTKKTPPLWREH